MEEDLKRAGKRIKALRNQLGLTTREFSKRVGMSHSYLSNIENGIKPVTFKILTKIANTFDVDVAEFLVDENTQPISEENEWYLFGKELEKSGITLEDVKLWVEIAKASKKK